MARIAEDGQLRNAAAQLDRNVPLRQIAVYLFIVTAESAVNGSQTFQPRVVDSFQCSDPKFEIRVYGIFYEYGNVDAF